MFDHSDILFSAVTFDIVGGGAKANGIVAQLTEADVALVAKELAHAPSGVVVVNSKGFQFAVSCGSLFLPTNGTPVTLRCNHFSEFSHSYAELLLQIPLLPRMRVLIPMRSQVRGSVCCIDICRILHFKIRQTQIEGVSISESDFRDGPLAMR